MINEFLKGFLDEQKKIVEENIENKGMTSIIAGKCTYFVFDFEHVEDIDFTALSILSEIIQRLLRSNDGIEEGEWSAPVVIFTTLNQHLYQILETESIISSLYPRGNFRNERLFPSLDLGLEYVEDALLSRSALIRRKWLAFDSFRKLHNQARAFALNDASDHVLGVRLGSQLFRFTRQIKLPAGSTLYEEGELDPCAYIIQSGRLMLHSKESLSDDGLEVGIGESEYRLVRVKCYKRGAVLNKPVLYCEEDDAIPLCEHTAKAEIDSIVFSLNKDDLKSLDLENPEASIQLHRRLAKSGTLLSVNRKDLVNRGYISAKQNVTTQENNTVLKQGKTFSTRGFLKVAQNRIVNAPLIREGLAAAGLKRGEKEKNSLLSVSSLNLGESSGRKVARKLAGSTLRTRKQLLNVEDFKEKFESFDSSVEQDWYKLTGGATSLTPDQLSTVLSGLSRHDANEMIWEADLTGRGEINFLELLEALVTVDEREIHVESVTGGEED